MKDLFKSYFSKVSTNIFSRPSYSKHVNGLLSGKKNCVADLRSAQIANPFTLSRFATGNAGRKHNVSPYIATKARHGSRRMGGY